MDPFATFMWKRIIIQIGAIVAIAAVLGAFVLAYNAAYNQVAGLDQIADERWARLSLDLQERYAGIPSLGRAIGPSLGADHPVLDEVMADLDRWEAAMGKGDLGKIDIATANLEDSISRLVTAMQNHPGIVASTVPREFLDGLKSTGEAIPGDRLSFNDGVMRYNQAISTFPASLWVENWGFPARGYFNASIGGK
ncbi:MAG TPA: LemA family protein [Methanomicrobiales archaeon]|nr:LemA family protein [Methanomicrobiales archaeon]